MGVGNLTNRSAGQTILDTFFNDIHSALDGDLVGRDSGGTPASGQNLGTVAFPWGTVRATSLTLNGSPVDTSQITSPPNRVVSGKVRTTSNQPAFVTPDGAAASFILKGATVNLVFDVNGTSVTTTTDITKSSLTLAPAANNTCLVNDTSAAGQASTRTWGEQFGEQDYITVDTMGANISALVGKYAAFKLAGGSTEYLTAFVESTTKLSDIRRGYFYDSTLTPVNRSTLSNNDTITLLSWGHVFVENNATTVDVSYTVPTVSATAPSSPATGDYWYDVPNSVWKRYDGASFQIINRTYVASVIITTAACVGARCQDFYANYQNEIDILVRKSTTSIVRAKNQYSTINVAGNVLKFGPSAPSWNITTDIAATPDSYSGSEQASRAYFFYLKDTGQTAISDIEPYFRDDLQGLYHPHNPWRCVGSSYNDSGSDLTSATTFDIKNCDPLHVGAYQTTPLSLANSSPPKKVTNVDTVYFDSHDGSWDTTNAQAYIVAPGFYELNAFIGLNGANANEIILAFEINGSTTHYLSFLQQTSATAAFRGGSKVVKLKIGDKVEWYVQQDSAGNLTTPPTGNEGDPGISHFQISRVR